MAIGFAANIKEDRRAAMLRLDQWLAMRIFAENNDFAAMIDIFGIQLYVCDNSLLLPVIDHNIEEINKFLNGEPNSYE